MDEGNIEVVKIPSDRIGALVGKNGAIKNKNVRLWMREILRL